MTLRIPLQYIGTMGSPVKLGAVSPNETLPFDFPYRVPADLKNFVSATTLKVLESGNAKADSVAAVDELRMTVEGASDGTEGGGVEIELSKVSHRILQRPVIKKDVPMEAQRLDKPTLDISLPHVSL